MWPFYIVMMTLGWGGWWILHRLGQVKWEVHQLRIEQHECFRTHATEQAAIAGWVAEIRGELKNEVTLNMERSVDMAEITKTLTELYQLEVTRTAMLIESTRCGVTIRNLNDPPITLEHIRDGAGPKVAMDVAEAMERGKERHEKKVATATRPEDGAQN